MGELFLNPWGISLDVEVLSIVKVHHGKLWDFGKCHFTTRHGFAVKSTVAKAILTPVMQRDFVGADVHPTTFREEP